MAKVTLDIGRSYAKIGLLGKAQPLYVTKTNRDYINVHKTYRQCDTYENIVNSLNLLIRDLFDKAGISLSKSVYSYTGYSLAVVTTSLALVQTVKVALCDVLFSDQIKFDTLVFLCSSGSVLMCCTPNSGLVVDLSGFGMSSQIVLDGALHRLSVTESFVGGNLADSVLKELLCTEFNMLDNVVKKPIPLDVTSNTTEASVEDIQGFTKDDLEQMRVRACYCCDLGKEKFFVDSTAKIRVGNKMVAIHKNVRCLVYELILFGLDFDKYTDALFIFGGEDKRQDVERIIQGCFERHYVPNCPYDRLGLLAMMTNTIERVNVLDSQFAVQNVMFSGGLAETPGLIKRLLQELQLQYSRQDLPATPATKGTALYDGDAAYIASLKGQRCIEHVNLSNLPFTMSNLSFIGASIIGQKLLTEKYGEENVLEALIDHYTHSYTMNVDDSSSSVEVFKKTMRDNHPILQKYDKRILFRSLHLKNNSAAEWMVDSYKPVESREFHPFQLLYNPDEEFIRHIVKWENDKL